MGSIITYKPQSGCQSKCFSSAEEFEAACEALESNQYIYQKGDLFPCDLMYCKIVNSNKPVEDESKTEVIKTDLDNRLTVACQDYQSSRTGGKCDSNFFSLLMAISAKETIGEKAQACLAWLDSLWIEEKRREDNNVSNFDFTGLGQVPHNFSAVRAEAE